MLRCGTQNFTKLDTKCCVVVLVPELWISRPCPKYCMIGISGVNFSERDNCENLVGNMFGTAMEIPLLRCKFTFDRWLARLLQWTPAGQTHVGQFQQ